jgi:hypothetical protein
MNLSKSLLRRNNKMVADAVLEKEYMTRPSFLDCLLTLPRKAKQLNDVFNQTFSWSGAIDAVADVYNGVSLPFLEESLELTESSSSSGPC